MFGRGVYRALAVCCAFGLSAGALGATIQVPGDFPTIQDAITAASPGDIIEIDPGTWTGPFVIVKDLSLRGMGTAPGDVVLTNPPSSTERVLVAAGAITATIENLSFVDAPDGAVRGQAGSAVACYGVVFRNNHAGTGGAIQLNGASAIVWDSRFIENTSTNRGSAIATTGFNSFSNLQINRSTFRRNTGADGVISVYYGLATINESLFEDANDSIYTIDARTNSEVSVINSILTGMSGIAPFYVGEDTELVITNATIADNECTGAGLASGSLPGSVDVRNSIVRFDESLPLAGAALTVAGRYSNITGGLVGPGIIDEDPMFKSGTLYELDAGSPCIDAADSTVTGAPVDYSGQPRFTDDLNVANNGNGPLPILDMGATERQPAIRYVDANAAPGGGGLSWETAMDDLQDALNDALSGDVEEIWIATGTYYPDRGTGDRTMAFEMQNNLDIIGGFAGTETRRDDRDPSAFPTTLGGAIGQAGIEDNTFHVVRAWEVDSSAVLRDVIIQRGNATGGLIEAGAGIFVYQGSPRFRDIIVRLCESDGGAAAIYTNQSDATFGRVRVLLNGLNSSPGGAVGFFGGSPLLLNSLVHGNSVSDLAAVNLVDNTSASIVNSTIVGNSSEGSVAGIYKEGGQAELHNSIVWGNTPANPASGQPLWADNLLPDGMDIRFTTVEGWGSTDANGANGYEPRFVDAAGPDGNPGNIDDDYRLAAGSCLIDSGDNGLVPSGADADFLRNPRFLDDAGMTDTGLGDAPIVDRGAYEFQGQSSCAADLNGDGQVDLADLNLVLANFGQSAPGGDSNCDGVLDLTDLNAVLASFGLTCN